MVSKALFLIGFMCVMFVLSGCNEQEAGGLRSLMGSGGLEGGAGGAGGGGGGGVAALHNPEPTTMVLMGSGLFAFAMLMRKKKK